MAEGKETPEAGTQRTAAEAAHDPEATPGGAAGTDAAADETATTADDVAPAADADAEQGERETSAGEDTAAERGESGPSAGEEGAEDDTAEAVPGPAAPASAEGGPRRVPDWLRPRLTLAQGAILALCLAAGFMVAAQVGQTQDETLTGMRQDDLVRLLDELSQRNDELAEEGQQLRQELAELRSSTSNQQAAQEAVEQQAQVYGVLAGVLPVQGPGIELIIQDPEGSVPAQTQVTILEELRNAGVEAIELNGIRLGTSSWIVDDEVAGIIVDGEELSPPYHWRALGDPETLSGALGIPGGALASVRNNGGSVELVEADTLAIHAVRTLEEPEHARPTEEEDE